MPHGKQTWQLLILSIDLDLEHRLLVTEQEQPVCAGRFATASVFQHEGMWRGDYTTEHVCLFGEFGSLATFNEI